MTRLWPAGQLLRAECSADGEPLAFTWAGRRHPVQHITNRWRADLGWWRLRIWREHFKVITETGLLVVIYHDLVNDQWYLQRLYD